MRYVLLSERRWCLVGRSQRQHTRHQKPNGYRNHEIVVSAGKIRPPLYKLRMEKQCSNVAARNRTGTVFNQYLFN